MLVPLYLLMGGMPVIELFNAIFAVAVCSTGDLCLNFFLCKIKFDILINLIYLITVKDRTLCLLLKFTGCEQQVKTES